MKMELIKMHKVSEPENALHKNNIAIGREFIGLSNGKPTVGECFYVGDLRTSVVQEILSPNTFRTYNSIYEWELI